MSDPLSVAASIAGLITIADIVVRKGYHYLRDFKGVEKTAKKLIDEVNVLSGILHSLKNVAEYLESDDYQFDPATQIHYVHSCQQSLKRIQEQLDNADPTPASGVKKLKKKLKWPFEKRKTEEFLAEIEEHKATMTLAMSADEMSVLLDLLRRSDVLQKKVDCIHSSVLEMQGVQHRVIEEKTKRKMLQYLGKLDIDKWQRTNLALRQPGTGIWFTDGEEFQSWTSTKNSKLWIYGIPGAGKTILISSIIQELSNFVDSKRGLAFFYCDYKDPQTHDPIAIFGELAKQLAVQNEPCLQELEHFYIAHLGKDGLERSTTPAELCDLIQLLAAHFDESMIIVDGLDEISSGRSDVTRLLSELSNTRGIKLILSSRPEVDIKRHLALFTPISIAACSADLQLYVASEIEKRISNGRLTIGDPSLKEEIMQTLVGGAEGMFRWVSCQMDYLCECSTDRERRNALKKLPPDLPSSYKRILERVNASTMHNQQLVAHTLQWVLFGERELSMPELLEALGCIDNETSFDRACLTTTEQLQYWCSSLVRMSTEGTLEIAHFTVKEYLMSIDPVQEPQFAHFRISESNANKNLAKACLSYLNYPIFKELKFPKVVDEAGQGQIVDFLGTYHFLSYATIFWDEHARALFDNQSIFKKVQCLFRPGPNRGFKFWKRLRFHLIRKFNDGVKFRDSDGYNASQNTTPLHWAAILALPHLCEWLLHQQLDVNQFSDFGPPLHCALLQGTTVDIEYEYSDWYEDNPIWRAVDRKIVVSLLIERSAVVDRVIPYSEKTPLAASIHLRLFEVVDLLLELGSKLTFEELQDIIEIQLETGTTWIGLPNTAAELAKLIIPDEEHDLEETTFRVGVILTVPWVNKEYTEICNVVKVLSADSEYEGDAVPDCLDVGYSGPLSESTLLLLRRTVVLLQLDSPSTSLALIGFLRNIETSDNELALTFINIVAQYLNYGYYAPGGSGAKAYKVSAILTVLEILESLKQVFYSDKRGNTLMHLALSEKTPAQIIDRLMKLEVHPTLSNHVGETLIHLAAQGGEVSVLESLFETYDCTSTLRMLTKAGRCPLTCAVHSNAETTMEFLLTVEFLLRQYSSAEEHVIKFIVQNAWHRNDSKVLEVMRGSIVTSGYLQVQQTSSIHGSIDEMGAIQTSLPYRITVESLLNVGDGSGVGSTEDVAMEDAV